MECEADGISKCGILTRFILVLQHTTYVFIYLMQAVDSETKAGAQIFLLSVG